MTTATGNLITDADSPAAMSALRPRTDVQYTPYQSRLRAGSDAGADGISCRLAKFRSEPKRTKQLFTVHALGTTLEIDDSVSNALAGFMVNATSLASSTITVVYNR